MRQWTVRVLTVAVLTLAAAVLGAAASPAPASGFCEWDICVSGVQCRDQIFLPLGCDFQGVYCVTYACSQQ